MRAKYAFLPALALGCLAAWSVYKNGEPKMPESFPALDASDVGADSTGTGTETATFGSGCFWCSEALFQRLNGVKSVTSGYSGGRLPNPSYDAVCAGTTGHAEVVQVVFDPAVISYAELLEVFWRTHDPTTLDRQGNDYGSQYRSAIFFHNDRQRQLAELYKKKIDDARVFSAPIVTEIVPFEAFYPAEDYHRDFYAQHSRQSYCRTIIGPKIEKLEKIFEKKLKPAS